MKRRKIRKRSDEVRLILGICWYTPDEFIRMKQIAIDGGDFEATYEEWLHSAERARKVLKRQNVNSQKVHVKTEDFRLWCVKNDLLTNGASRTRYVAEILKSENDSKRKPDG